MKSSTMRSKIVELQAVAEVEPDLPKQSRQPFTESIADRPTISLARAHDLMRAHYGLQGELKPLPSERDQNFHVLASDQRQWVLKIANLGTSIDALECQDAAMSLVRQRVGPTACPVAQPNRAGELVTRVPRDDAAGDHLLIRLVDFLPGVPLAHARPHHPSVHRAIGEHLGRVAQALVDLDDARADRDLRWDLAKADEVISTCQPNLDDQQRERIEAVVKFYRSFVAPRVPSMRRSIIHGDANDHNIILATGCKRELKQVSIIDFGDLVRSQTIHDVAIAMAYIMLDQFDPIGAACDLIGGYHQAFPLTEEELSVVFPLAQMRLAVSVSLAQVQAKAVADDPYLSVTQQPAWNLLERLTNSHHAYVEARLRDACRFEPCAQGPRVTRWLNDQSATHGSVLKTSSGRPQWEAIDLDVATEQFATDLLIDATHPSWDRQLQELGVGDNRRVGVGGYGEPRMWYQGERFDAPDQPFDEPRTIHLGVDLFAPAGTEVLAPIQGRVVCAHDNDFPLDYGPTVILEHETDAGDRFYTLYGHLSRAGLKGLSAGQSIEQGETIGRLGTNLENGGWPPHLHFQVMCDLWGHRENFPGVASPSQRDVWLSNCIDPNLLLQVPASRLPRPKAAQPELHEARQRWISPSLSLSYDQPLHIVRGHKQFLYDAHARRYLDCVNNVCHVGHSHARVVAAASRQMSRLNTNTRYLHANLVQYAEQLVQRLPDPLEVCFLVNSGSEANDLALRLVASATGRPDWLVIDGAYHGNLSSLIDISPYKHNGPGGGGTPSNVHVLDLPDSYRGRYRTHRHEGGVSESVERYARDAVNQIQRLAEKGRAPGGFIAESILSCGGQIVLPDGYLATIYEAIRDCGGICVADEVQVGFGRVGSHFWGFETQGVVPDIVTMGKPIGNGHPIGAVVTTREIADAFHNGMEYFNTFGGNPVSAAVALEVLKIIEDEQLQDHAREVGGTFLELLNDLADKHESIGDVRGRGLFLGIELVSDRESRVPDAAAAAYIVRRCREWGILLSTDGPDHNVIKIKPPMVFDLGDARRVVAAVDSALSDVIRS